MTLNNHEEQKLIRQDYIQVITSLNGMDQVLQWFKQFNRFPLKDELWMQAQIALIEGFTNAVQHAHRNLPSSTPIGLSVKVFSHKLEISIWDQGPAFDLEALFTHIEQHHHDPLEREAHWGGILIKKLRDQHDWKIRYTCDTTNHQNMLLMQKEFAVSSTAILLN
jgi:serine/threonine-protein kinase RsbW